MGQRARRLAQRGLAALAFVLVLLFAMSLALLWTGRSLVFEHRAAANQQRQAVAFAAAESGLGWAVAKLNDPRALDARCMAASAAISVATSGSSFRERYASPWIAAPAMTTAFDARAYETSHTATSGYAPLPRLRAACRIETQQLVCDCSASPGAAVVTSGGTEGPSFAIELAAVVGETQALWLVSRGCSAAWAECSAAQAAQTESQATLRVKLRLADHAGSNRTPTGMNDEIESLRSDPLVSVPGSWRDGHCTATAMDDSCGFEP